MNQKLTQSNYKISCIVPCFNEDSEALRKSLDSIANQTYENFECIVVDESTNAKTAEFCRELCGLDPRFHYLRPEKRLGLAGSLNLGIQKAKGEYIARFDSDDICSPDRFSLQAQFLNQNSDISIVGSSLEIIDNNDLPIGIRAYPIEHDAIEKKFIFSNGMAHPTVMFRKSLLSIVCGAYDPTFRYAEDLEFWLRLLNSNIKFANLPECLVKYRQQYTNRSGNHWKYNIKARIKNFSNPFRFKKVMGILGIALWMYLPKKLQQFLFKAIQFRKA
ncbi:glycosyltransferase [Polynucleobacter paneuropaeus]|jgi:glycosyltransferase involved in cell wall biosynthesis|nr:glycosyltransferase [Polynucleobacter paneuropaeus]